MSQKPDYYEVLGVAKTASANDIKMAYQRIVMRNHPDMRKKKGIITPEQIAEADATFKIATEAEGVLSDPAKRETYDKFGHKGIENLAAGKSAGSGRTYADVAGPTERRVYSEDDTMSFFTKRAEKNARDESAASDGLTTEQRRERARQERLARRGRTDTPAAGETFPSASSTNAFHKAAEKASEAAEALKDNSVIVPLDALERLRENLQDFIGEVDKAIAKAKRAPGGPKP